MIYVGLDVGGKSMAMCAVTGKGKRVVEGEVPSTRTGLRRMVGELGTPLFVAFEAGNQMRWVAECLRKQEGVTVHVVHPNAVKLIANSNGKTDKVDARKLAELARLDGLPRAVHLVEGVAAELRVTTSVRSLVVDQATRLKNLIRGQLKQDGVQLPEKFFSRKDWKTLVKVDKLSKPVRALWQALVPLLEATQQAEGVLREEIEGVSDKRTKLLESIPGIGKLNSRVLVGALDDAKRFETRKQVAKYGALAPTIRQSGKMLQLGPINVDGRREVRQAMLQSAHCVARQKSGDSAPLRAFYEKVKRRGGTKRAVVALARKLLTVAYAVLKTQKPYNPAMLAAG